MERWATLQRSRRVAAAAVCSAALCVAAACIVGRGRAAVLSAGSSQFHFIFSPAKVHLDKRTRVRAHARRLMCTAQPLFHLTSRLAAFLPPTCRARH
jgi:hypothetical protein